ncbi:hypothetical protein Tco_1247238 [Tanacetum coccineum]
MNTTYRESSSKTDDRIDKLADQISTLVEIVTKKVVTPAMVKAVEESYVICSDAHAYYNCNATDRNQSSVCAATEFIEFLKKFRNNIKPAKRIPNVNKPEKRISKGYRFSPNKSFVVHEKPKTLRSCLRWKPTGNIFKIAGLRWIPTGKMLTDSTTKVDSEPSNGSNDEFTNPYECDQTLNVNAGTLNLSACTSFNPIKERLRVWLPKSLISHKPGVLM